METRNNVLRIAVTTAIVLLSADVQAEPVLLNEGDPAPSRGVLLTVEELATLVAEVVTLERKLEVERRALVECRESASEEAEVVIDAWTDGGDPVEKNCSGRGDESGLAWGITGGVVLVGVAFFLGVAVGGGI